MVEKRKELKEELDLIPSDYSISNEPIELEPFEK